MDRPNRQEMYGPFEVLERLGIGGMATVHRAIERGVAGFEREVALKRLLPHLAEDEAFLRLFVREAKLASMLQHGNIVQLYELGRVGASYFISMEYIVGRDLRNAIWRARRVVGPPPVAVTLAILSELLDALDYAHNRRDEAGQPMGLIHRDISPSNLIINESGHLKVIDFGVAKATQGHMQTQTGGLKGKLSYMPPEMLACRPLDARSDLFSASVIAHELLTTAPLFTGESEFQTMDRVQRMVPPPPSAKNRECPPELDAIVLKGLAKDPDRRWSSAAELRAALAELVVRFRLHATSREVAGWMDWAFGPKAARKRLPLAAPEEATPSQPSAEEIDASPVVLNERDFEAAWDWLRSGAAPIVLEDVPDVSDRLAAAAPLVLPPGVLVPRPDEDAPTVALEVLPDTDVVPRMDAAALGLELPVAIDAPPPMPPVWQAPAPATAAPAPAEWADGTPSAAPPPAPARDATVVRLRPSPLRAVAVVVIAAVAITAGAAYILRGDRRPVRRPAPASAKRLTPAVPPASAAPAATPPGHDAPALVPPERVKLRRGEPPRLRLAETGPTPPVLDAELCVDSRGRVAAVKILTPVSTAARAALTRELGTWRYRPIELDGHRIAGCFHTRVTPTLE
ncbi:MAG TPA: serine/threonine-protein kinase [Kofleriaceae bacterium]|nr:serine/threonine-protein kinase [Kofleriaceae bacterium]